MSVMEVQHGGDHYKGVPAGYQPIEIAEKLGLSATEFSVLKYLLRYKKKSGLVDLKKMMHFGQMLIKMHYGVETTVAYQETASESSDSWKAVEAERKVADGVRGISPLKDALDALQASVPPARIGKMWSPSLPVEVVLTPVGSMGSSVEDQKQYLREALGVQSVPHASVVEAERKVADGVHGVSPLKEALDFLQVAQKQYVHETLGVTDSPDPATERVTQDRVPARPGVDEFRWSSWTGHSEWLVVDTWASSCGKMHGHEEGDGDTLSLRCRREDLPAIGEMKPDLDGRSDMQEPVKKGGPADHLLPEKRDYPGPSPAEIEDCLLLPEFVSADEVPVVVDDDRPF